MTGPEPEPPWQSLGEAALTAVRWVFAARLVAEIVAFGSSLVLARLITPADFGRAAIALIFTGGALILVAALFTPALVQRRELRAEHWAAAAGLGLAVGGGLTALSWLAAGPLLGALVDDRTESLVRLASPAFAILGVSVVPQARMQRRLDFRRLGLIEIVSTLTGAVTALTLTLAGVDAEALVIGPLAGLVALSAGSLLAAGVTLPSWRPREMRELASFGLPAGIAALGGLSSRQIDYPIVAAQLGPAQLGAYWRAFTVAAEYQTKITTVMTRVAFPLYSRGRDIAEIRRMRTRVVRTHATVIFPLLALLVVTAPELIPLLYGPAWDEAIVPAQILAGAGVVGAVSSGMAPVVLAVGRPRELMVFAWSFAAVYGLVIYLFAPLGLTAVCIASVAANALAFLIAHHLLLGRLAGIPLRALAEDAGAATLASAIMVAPALGLTALLSSAGAPGAVLVGVAGCSGLAIYALAIRRLSPAAWSDLRLVAGRVLRRDRASTPPASGP